MVSVFRVSEDGLCRQRWDFRFAVGYHAQGIVLSAYGIERRKSTKSRFAKAIPRDRWQSPDERHYNSGLSRPEAIPGDVVREALLSEPVGVYIGWTNAESKVGEMKIVEAAPCGMRLDAIVRETRDADD